MGNYRLEHFQELVKDRIKTIEAMGCIMYLEPHILDVHLNRLKENMGSYTEEQD